MTDLQSLLNNRNLTIGLIILVLFLLYSGNKKECGSKEGLNSVPLNLAPTQALTDVPFTSCGGRYRHVNNNFDRFADAAYSKAMARRGHTGKGFLGRSDVEYDNYARQTNFQMDRPYNNHLVASGDTMGYPRPTDRNVGMNSNCQPCNGGSSYRRSLPPYRSPRAYQPAEEEELMMGREEEMARRAEEEYDEE